jgi:hypothetical protein
MATGQERRKLARLEHMVGNLSRDAQERVDKRVMEIMSRRDDAERPPLRSDQASRRSVASRW